MSALQADILASLRSGLSAGLNAQTVTYAVNTDGTLGTPVSLYAIITVQTRTQIANASGHSVELADVISVRPMEAETIVVGDVITYGGHDYRVRETAGTDIRRITAAYVPTVGFQRTDRFRAEGG